MKAQINLFLQDDNSFRGIYDGTPMDFGAMLHRMASDSAQLKSALLLATSAVLKDAGFIEIPLKINKIVFDDLSPTTTPTT